MVRFARITYVLLLAVLMLGQSLRLRHLIRKVQQPQDSLSGSWMMCQQYHSKELMEFFELGWVMRSAASAGSYGVRGGRRSIRIYTDADGNEHLVTKSNSSFFGGTESDITIGAPMSPFVTPVVECEAQAEWDKRDLHMSLRTAAGSAVEIWMAVAADGLHKSLSMLFIPYKKTPVGDYIKGAPMAQVWMEGEGSPCGDLPTEITQESFEADFKSLMFKADANGHESEQQSEGSNVSDLAMFDVTDRFLPDLKQTTLDDGVTYSCCCWHEDTTERISCRLVDVNGPWASWVYSGCGGILGYGFHSWNTIPTIPEYASIFDAGKCVVPYGKLPSALTTTTTTSPEFVDITDRFSSASISAPLDDGFQYSCCCKHEEESMTIPCILTKIEPEVAKAFWQELNPRSQQWCGFMGVMGIGFHMWNKIPKSKKLQESPNAGRCVIPHSMLPQMPTT